MKSKSMIGMILALILSLGWSGEVNGQVLQITENIYEDTFPQTKGGYVVWQTRIDGQWEIFLYNINDAAGAVQLTDNTYGDINPQTDGQYVTWTAGSAPNGEIFIYEIATTITTQLTDNQAIDVRPKIVNGLVVWESKNVDYVVEPGDILLHDIVNNSTTNVSRIVDPENDFDDHSSRFDGQRVFWIQDDGQGNSVSYVHYLATGSTLPVSEDFSWRDSPQADGNLYAFTRIMGGDREIVLRDRKGHLSGQLTENDIEDTQPCISDNIMAWVGGRGDDREIYIYKLPPFTADAGPDMTLATENVANTMISGVVAGATGGLTYRWLSEGIELSSWQPVIGRRAVFDLGSLSGLVTGTYPFVLEVTNGEITMTDEMMLAVQTWYLTIVSPDNGIIIQKNKYPVFTWESNGYKLFKIQFSSEKNFRKKRTITYPRRYKAWLRETYFTVGDEAKQLNRLKKRHQKIYWRVLAKDKYGNKKIGQVQSVNVVAKNIALKKRDRNNRLVNKKRRLRGKQY